MKTKTAALDNKNNYFIQGNEACVLAALNAGASFFSGYPISPSTEIAELCSTELPKRGGYYLQMEDELSGLAAVIGASLAGRKAFTATSGPGFSLMQENIGLASMVEAPCVIINVQRYGLSTGIATKPAQADVMQARWGTHGDHGVLALAPSSVQECYDLVVTAFNLAEKLRTPVIVLTDAVTAHLREKIYARPPEELDIWERPKPQGDVYSYLPYRPGENMVPHLSNYGDSYILNVTGLVHDERGYSTADPHKAEQLTRRLIDKLRLNRHLLPSPSYYGSRNAKIVVLSYGITARSARAAAERAAKAGLPLQAVKLPVLWPFPAEEVKNICRRADIVVVPEMNSGQLIREVERYASGRCKVSGLNKINTEIITPQEIINFIREVIK